MATVDVALNTPLAEALSNVVQPKLSEVGWSTDGDDSALSEYIILMLVNGKTKDQIASELSNDLLSLPPEDTGATEFASWLFHQVQVLSNQLNGGAPPQQMNQSMQSAGDQGISIMGQGANNGAAATGNTEMADAMEGVQNGAVPTGPKSMRSTSKPSGPRLMGQINKAMDRTSDPLLHRVRSQQGTERINMHGRMPPKGPKNEPRPNARMLPNGRGSSAMRGGHNLGANGVANGPLAQMTPHQQMQLMAMYEEQAKMMAQIFNPSISMAGSNLGSTFGAMPVQQQQNAGPSLFDRVEPNPRHNNGHFGRRPHHNNTGPQNRMGNGVMSMDAGSNNEDNISSSMEVESSQTKPPGETVCKFNKHCTKQDCPYAHQSPAAKDGAPVDTGDVCKFGAACQNYKCTGSHPSPAQKIAYHTEQDCKYFPNCTNPKCVFRHPEEKLCKFGKACTRTDCKFIHPKAPETNCKFNPCLNPACIFKHVEGQQRGKFGDKVWTADQERNHVSDRKFVDDEMKDEELVLPETKADEQGGGSQHSGTEVVT